MNKNLLAILTPTYNRAELLTRVYESLKNQTNKNFVWYIVDDGSVDGTSEIVNGFINEEKIKIQYYKKENGGKHTAVNLGLEKIEEEFTLILDSDDALTLDACQIILNDLGKLTNDFCGLGYLKANFNGQVVGKKYTKDYVEDTFINQRYNKNTWGDKAEVFRTSLLKQYPFPVFNGEKFLSESTIWCQISGKYKMAFYNKIVYNCEYQVGGLSDGVRKTLFKNPKGASCCYKVLSGKGFSLKNKIKYTILHLVHLFADNKTNKEIKKEVNNKFLGFVLYLPAKYIYLKRKKAFTNKK